MEMRKIMTAMDELLEEYREYLWDEERSRATVEKYLRDVKVFMKYLADDGAEEKPGDRIVDKEKVREYKNFLREHYKVSSANSMLAALNSFFMFAGWEELKVKSA